MPKFPYWRYVRYTDDGCCIYQCLWCMADWELRSGMDGWKLCPVCGLEWKGEQEWEEDRSWYDRRNSVYWPTWEVQNRTVSAEHTSEWTQAGGTCHWASLFDALRSKREAEAEQKADDEEWAEKDIDWGLVTEFRIVRRYKISWNRGIIVPLGEPIGPVLRKVEEELRKEDERSYREDAKTIIVPRLSGVIEAERRAWDARAKEVQNCLD